MGQCIANWTGLRTEGQVINAPFLTDAAWGTSPFPARPWITLDEFLWGNPWLSDDDTDIEYIYLQGLHSRGTNRLSPDNIRQDWMAHVEPQSYVWVSNLAARDLMSAGLRPPMTALAQGLHSAASFDQSLMIDAQLTTEFFGLLCPGMPERALAMADLPIRTTARGYALHASQFHVVLYSLASVVDPSLSPRDQVLWLVREARKFVPSTSRAAEVIDFVLADYLANSDRDNWELTRDRIHQRYQAQASANGFVYRAWYEAPINLATGVMCLLYGEGDFSRTIRIGTLSGWDSDNPTATMGGLVAFMRGSSFFTAYPAVQDTYWILRTRVGFPDLTPTLPGEDTFTLMGQRMLPIIDREVTSAGGVAEATGSSLAPAGLWVLPPGGAGGGLTPAAALALSPSQQDMLASATWTIRSLGGSVLASSNVPGSPAFGFGSGNIGLVIDGQETDTRGLEEFGQPRGFYSTQRTPPAPTPPGPHEITITYDRPLLMSGVRIITGAHFSSGTVQGGWAETWTIEVLSSGQWTAPPLQAPPQLPSAQEPFALRDLAFVEPISASALRLRAGIPPATPSGFITIMELDARLAITPPAAPTFDLTGDARVTIDDLYAFVSSPADLNRDGQSDDRDLRQIEMALRTGELRRMNTR